MAQHQDTKTGGIAPDIRRTPNLRKTSNIRTISNIRKTLNLRITLDIRITLNIRKVLDIRKILLPLDSRNRTYGVSEARENKACRPVLDAEEVTVSPSTNAKGLRILLSKDLYICLIEED